MWWCVVGCIVRKVNQPKCLAVFWKEWEQLLYFMPGHESMFVRKPFWGERFLCISPHFLIVVLQTQSLCKKKKKNPLFWKTKTGDLQKPVWLLFDKTNSFETDEDLWLEGKNVRQHQSLFRIKEDLRCWKGNHRTQALHNAMVLGRGSKHNYCNYCKHYYVCLRYFRSILVIKSTNGLTAVAESLTEATIQNNTDTERAYFSKLAFKINHPDVLKSYFQSNMIYKPKRGNPPPPQCPRCDQRTLSSSQVQPEFNCYFIFLMISLQGCLLRLTLFVLKV